MKDQTAGLLANVPREVVDGLFAGLRAALGTGGSEANAAALERVGDWNTFARLAKRHRVVSLALRGLRRAGAASPAAEAVLGPMRAAANARGLSQLEGLRVAVDCLDKQGVPSLVLKGLPLGVRLFGTPLERECYDIDLLVPPSRAGEAAQALRASGWAKSSPSFEPTPARDRFFEKYVCNRVLSGPGGTLELHHRLTNNPFALPADFAELAANAETVTVGDSTFQVLGDRELLLYLCVHGEMHRWSRLKWLCDVAAMIDSAGEEGLVEALENCQRHGMAVEPVFGTALRLCREYLQVQLPPAAASLASGPWTGRRVRKTRRLWTRPRGGRGLQGAARRIDQVATALSINPCWRSAVRELARMFAPPYDLGRVNLPDRLFFLYWPLRPVLLLASSLERGRARPATTKGSGRNPDQGRHFGE